MGYIIKKVDDWTPGAGAVTKDFPLAKAPLHALILNWDMLGQGAAAVIASAKIQCGTYIYLKDGGETITPKWNGAELGKYGELFLDRNTPFQDGTAADNKLALMSLVLPLGRPMGTKHSGFPMPLLDPLVGFNPKNTPYLHIEIPADGNAIDTRHLKIVAVYKTEPFAYCKKWTDWASQTLSTSAWTDWTIGAKGLFLEAMLWATSGYNGTLTADAPTLLKMMIQRQEKDVAFEGEIPNVLGSLLNDDVMADDNYLYMNFSQAPFDNFQNCIRLLGDTKFRAYGGVADALIAAFSVISEGTY